MTLSEYTRLRQQVVFTFGNSKNHSYLLNELKEFYKDDIDSERRYEEITSLGKLLRVLEIRDVLSEDNVTPLKEICKRLNNSELLGLISDYEHTHIPRQYINYYTVQKANESIKTSPERKKIEQETLKHPCENLSPRKMKRINDTLIEELGTFWRNLARNLKIREGKIDDIDATYDSLAEKARHMLALYNEISDPQRWFFVLCDALEKTRRKDLKKSLQSIMAMNI